VEKGDTMKEIVQKFQEDIEGLLVEVTITEEDTTIKIVVEDQDIIIQGDIVAVAVAEGAEAVVVEIGPPEEERDIVEVVRVVMEKEEMGNIVVVVEEVVVVIEVKVIIMIVEEVIVEVEVVVMQEIKKEKKEEVKKMKIILKQ
jgi:hypothetical protein